jgi:hypothetical protein
LIVTVPDAAIAPTRSQRAALNGSPARMLPSGRALATVVVPLATRLIAARKLLVSEVAPSWTTWPFVDTSFNWLGRP